MSSKSSDTTDSCTSALITKAVRHDEYYFEDGNVIIQVENTLFNVFRSTFTRHSKFFEDLFSPKSLRLQTTKLTGISSIDFERLLWILYPPSFGTYKHQTSAEWISVLRLAKMWDFDDIRLIAIQEIECYPLNPVEKISLSAEFNISSQWTSDAETELCKRPEPLTLPEAEILGLSTTVRIARLRERLRSQVVVPPRSLVGAMLQSGIEKSSKETYGYHGK